VKRLLLLLLPVTALLAADPAIIRYSKDFPGSSPAHAAIWVGTDGKGEFTDAPDGGMPISFQLTPSETEAIFGLAAKLDHFTRPLESGLKVAFTGDKVFRYEQGSTKNEVKFNYSTDPDAKLLLDWFERLTETSMHVINLEHVARYDRLGVDQALRDLQMSADQNRLAGTTQLLPILDRLARSKSAFNRVRQRAAIMAEAIRAGQPKTE